MKFLIATLSLSALLLASCADTGTDTTVTVTPTEQNQVTEEVNTDDMNTEEGVLVGGAMMVPSLDIVDNAINASNVTTLVAAVQAADLVDTLKSEGPFTVFAPTNDAFNALPEGTVDSLLLPENKDTLTQVLTYHVVAGAYTSADLTDGMELETVEGKKILITYENGVWMINGAAIQTADVISSNGVTHVIDTVLMPVEDKDTVEAADKN